MDERGDVDLARIDSVGLNLGRRDRVRGQLRSRDRARENLTGCDRVSRDLGRRDSVRLDLGGRDSLGLEGGGVDRVGPDSDGRDRASLDQGGRDRARRDVRGRDLRANRGRNHTARDRSGPDTAADSLQPRQATVEVSQTLSNPRGEGDRLVAGNDGVDSHEGTSPRVDQFDLDGLGAVVVDVEGHAVDPEDRIEPGHAPDHGPSPDALAHDVVHVGRGPRVLGRGEGDDLARILADPDVVVGDGLAQIGGDHAAVLDDLLPEPPVGNRGSVRGHEHVLDHAVPDSRGVGPAADRNVGPVEDIVARDLAGVLGHVGPRRAVLVDRVRPGHVEGGLGGEVHEPDPGPGATGHGRDRPEPPLEASNPIGDLVQSLGGGLENPLPGRC